MPAADIVFFDIAKFSERSTTIQKKIIQSLTKRVRQELQSMSHENWVALPTGDGMVLVFPESSRKREEMLLKLIVDVLSWSDSYYGEGKPVKVRIGVHDGRVEFIKDINGKRNVCGDDINVAQRVMDAATENQVLFSSHIFHHYVGKSRSSFTVDLGAGRQAQIKVEEDEVPIVAKHGRPIAVHCLKASIDGKRISSWKDPLPKMVLEFSGTPKPSIDETRLQKSKKVALIHLTGSKLLNAWTSLSEKELASLFRGLQELWFFMPHPDHYAGLISFTTPSESLKEARSKWEEFLEKLGSSHAHLRRYLVLCQNPPYYSAEYYNWDQKGGCIKISPYVWGVRSEECPEYTLTWSEKKPSEFYTAYLRGLKTLMERHQETTIAWSNSRMQPTRKARS